MSPLYHHCVSEWKVEERGCSTKGSDYEGPIEHLYWEDEVLRRLGKPLRVLLEPLRLGCLFVVSFPCSGLAE
jgi:hypothetical protein